MSILGILHTAISVLAIIMAIVALLKTRKIDPYSSAGKTYSLLTAVACITAFPLSKAGGFNPGHAIGILILILLAVVYLLIRENKSKKTLWNYISVVAMSSTLFLSLVPAVNETLSRLPLDHPIASGPQDPIVQKTLLGLFVLFLTGLAYQLLQVKKLSK